MLVLPARPLQIAVPDALRRTVAVGEKDAYVMLPPQAVCDGQTRDMIWTSDGSALVVLRKKVEGNRDDLASLAMQPSVATESAARLRTSEEIVAWSAASRRSRVVLSLPVGTEAVDLEPMAGSSRVVVATTTHLPATANAPEVDEGGILLLDVATGGIVPLDRTTDGSFDSFSLSPNRPFGALVRVAGRGKLDSVRFFGPSGTAGDWQTVPLHQHVFFDKIGGPGLRSVVTGADGKRHLRFQPIDPATGRLGESVDLPTILVHPVSPVLTVSESKRSAPPGADAPTVLLAAKGGKSEEAGVVTTDGGQPLLSPTFDAVAYVSQGGTFVRPLVRIDPAAYAAARLAGLKALAISNAKQAALGLLMYSADYDGNFPKQGEYEGIGPYVKDSSIMGSFTYTFGGGNAADIDNPAGTEIGYVSGPGGRAVAYADGHVRWIPDVP